MQSLVLIAPGPKSIRRDENARGDKAFTAPRAFGVKKARFHAPKGLVNHISVCLCVVVTENDIFRALADPTRRAIFEKLADGAMNASALREGIEISQPAMSQHLSVLRGAGLVVEKRQGRFVNYEVDPDGLTRIAAWLGKYRAYWPQRIEALKLLLKDMDQ